MGTFSATFTLTAESSENVGGFNITGNPGEVSIATNISRAALATGVTYNDIADTITEFTIASTGDCTNSVTKEINPTPTPTPTATPTVTVGTGQCYEFQVDSGVNQSNYGVRYTLPGQNSQDELFSQMLSFDGGSSSLFKICSTVDPTLLDYTGGFAVGVGSVNGITRTGPNGSCANNFDCSSNPTTYYSCSGGTCLEDVAGTYTSLEDCQASCS